MQREVARVLLKASNVDFTTVACALVSGVSVGALCNVTTLAAVLSVSSAGQADRVDMRSRNLRV